LSSADLLLIKFFSQNHSGDVNNHSGRIGFFIHFTPESIFTSRRNHYSHHSGTIIHMPRNPQQVCPVLDSSDQGYNLRMLLMRAYGVQSYQVEGPGTIDSERYDAFAKVPDGEPPQRIPEMLQNMLVERFRIRMHWLIALLCAAFGELPARNDSRTSIIGGQSS
jgi:hypothetical protein